MQHWFLWWIPFSSDLWVPQLECWTSKLFVVSNWLAIYFSPKYGFLSKLLVKKSIRKPAFCQCDVLRGKIIIIYTRFYYSLPRLHIFHNFKALINYLRFRIVHKFFQENVKVGSVLSWGPTRIWPPKSSPPTQVPSYLPTQGWLYLLHSIFIASWEGPTSVYKTERLNFIIKSYYDYWGNSCLYAFNTFINKGCV